MKPRRKTETDPALLRQYEELKARIREDDRRAAETLARVNLLRLQLREMAAR